MYVRAAVVLLCFFAFSGTATAATRTAATKKKTAPAPRSGVGVECFGCFPDNYSSCLTARWDKCCRQEVECHDDRCRGQIMGNPEKGMRAVVHTSFHSDDEEKVLVRKGLTGKVLELDKQGDAYMKFWDDNRNSEDEHLHQWVFKRTYWANFDLPGGSDEFRDQAAAVTACLDQCTMDEQKCRKVDSLSSRTKEDHGQCVKGCRMDKCVQKDACQKFFMDYATCKRESTQQEKCKAGLRKASKPAKQKSMTVDDSKDGKHTGMKKESNDFGTNLGLGLHPEL